MATAFFINISSGMRPHTHTHSHTPTHIFTVRESLTDIKREEDKGTTFPGDTLVAAVLMQASATVWSGATFPPHRPGFTAANLSHIQCWEKEVADLCRVPLSQSSHCGAEPGSE